MTQTTDPASTEGEAASPTQPSGNLISSAQLVAAGILLSRVSGLVREMVFSRYFGTSPFASAFRAATRLPNVLQNLLGEGTLSASFIPVYSRLLDRGETEAAGRLAGAIFSLLFAVAGALALIGVLLAPVLVDFFLPGFEGELRDLTVLCTRIIFPMTGILVLSAWALGILNSHRHFFVSYTAPVLWNVAIISTLFLMGDRVGQRDLVVAISWGALIGGGLQFLVQLPWVLKLERSLRFSGDFRSPHVATVIRNAGPAIMGRGVVQLSGWVDLWLASFLFGGALAALGYAQTLYMLPVSLFGMSIAASELPELSRAGAAELDPLRRRVEAGLRQMAVFVVPSVVGYLLLGDIIVGAMYEGREFDRGDTILVYLILAGYSIGLFASTGSRLYSSAFFALDDTRTPAKIAFIRVVLSAIIGGSLMILLEPITVRGVRLGPDTGLLVMGNPLGAAGLALGTGAAAWVEWLLLRRALDRRAGPVAARGVLFRLVAAASIGAVFARGLLMLLPDMPLLLAAIVALVPFGLIYFAIAHRLGVTEASSTMRRVTSRFTRRAR
ncbi:MAG: murein biosynthesis integral membrane protein MurJ [Gemmatimonadota bacterium]